MTPTLHQLEQKRQRVLRKLPELAEVTRGSVVERYLRCGQPNCRCKQPGERGHGPYYYLTTTLGAGKTRTLLLSATQVQRAQRWTDNFKQLREALEQVTELNCEILKLERRAERKRGSGKGRR